MMRINPKDKEDQQCPNCDELSFISQEEVVGVKELSAESYLGALGLEVFQCNSCGYVMFFNNAIVNTEKAEKELQEYIQQLKGEKS